MIGATKNRDGARLRELLEKHNLRARQTYLRLLKRQG